MSYINLKEAAEFLGIKAATLTKWVQAKKIPHYKVTARPLFKKAELEKFMEMRRVAAIPRLKQPRARRTQSAA